MAIDINSLTEQDVNFLKTLKDQGVSQEEAFGRLEAVKTKLTPQPEPEGKFAQGFKKSHEVEQGFFKGALGLVKTGLDAADKLNVTGALEKASGGQDISSSELIPEEAVKGQTGAEKLGKTVFDIGSVFLGAGGGRAAGAGAVKGIAALAPEGQAVRKIVEKGIPFATESLAGSTAASSAVDQELPSKGELGAGLLIDLGLGTTGILLKKALNPLIEAVKTGRPNLLQDVVTTGKMEAKKNLDQLGVSIADQNILKQIPEELKSKALQYLEQSKKRASQTIEGNTQVKGAMDLVAEDVGKLQQKLDGYLSSAGKSVGSEADKLKEAAPLNMSGALDRLVERLKALNVKVTSKGLNFKNSDMADLLPDQKFVQETYDFLRSKATRNPRDILAKVRNLSNKLFAGRGEITASKGPVKVVRDELRDLLGNMPGEYGQMAKDYSAVLEAKSSLESAVKDNAERGPEFLRRLFGRSPGKAQSVVEEIQKISEKLGIEEGKNLTQRAAMAELFDRVAEVQYPQGLSGQVAEGLERGMENISALTGKTGFFKSLYNQVADFVVGTPEETTKIEAVKKFLQANDDPELVKKMIPAVEHLLQLPGAPLDYLISLRALLLEALTD